MGSLLHSSASAQHMDTNLLRNDSKLRSTVALAKTSLVVMAGSNDGDYFKVSNNALVIHIASLDINGDHGVSKNINCILLHCLTAC